MVSIIIWAHDSQSKPASHSLFCSPYPSAWAHTSSLSFSLLQQCMRMLCQTFPPFTSEYFLINKHSLSFLNTGLIGADLQGKRLAYLRKCKFLGPSLRDSIQLGQGDLGIFIFNKSGDPKLVVCILYTEKLWSWHMALGSYPVYCLLGFPSLNLVPALNSLHSSPFLCSPQEQAPRPTLWSCWEKREGVAQKYKLEDSRFALRCNWGFCPLPLHSSGKAATDTRALVNVLLIILYEDHTDLSFTRYSFLQT